MFAMLFFIAVGIVIGWNLPQPPWAREWQQKAVDTIRSIAKRPGN